MTEDKKEPQLVDEIVKEAKANSSLAESKPKRAKVTLKLKQSPPIKPKFYYDVKVECLLPATLTYRVLAETPEQAAEMIKGMSPTGVKHRLIGKKDLKLSVYDAGSTFLKWIKHLAGK